jgi:hypothetical protein
MREILRKLWMTRAGMAIFLDYSIFNHSFIHFSDLIRNITTFER